MKRLILSSGILVILAMAIVPSLLAQADPHHGSIIVDWAKEKTELSPLADVTTTALSLEKGSSFLRVLHPDGSATPRLVNGKIEMEVGNRTHRYYVKGTGTGEGLEYEIIYAVRPASDTEVLTLEVSDDLAFHYQPELTQEQKDKGWIRPDDVVGSYAIYWKDIIKNGEPPQKFGHIYRPNLVDANGQKVWVEMKIDEVAKTLTMTLPKAWMDSAAYPVTLK